MKNSAVLIKEEGRLIEHLKQKLGEVFSPGDRVAVKLHMGEPGNKHYLKSDFTKKIIGILLDSGCRPFIFDTPVVYFSPRGSVDGYLKAAAKHGYDEKNMKAPVVISDRGFDVEGKLMKYRLASEPVEADGVLLLTHFKGHVACGAGGAIKNIGMGCMTKSTKGKIHTGGEPLYESGCTECGTCVENCPTDNIIIEDGGPSFGQTWCPGCSNCVINCPENVIKAKTAPFGHLMAEAACLAHERFKKFYAINSLRGITKLCDCVADAGPVILDDIGFVCAEDMVSADLASLKLVAKKTGSSDFFREHNRTTAMDHVKAAAEILGRDLGVDIKRI